MQKYQRIFGEMAYAMPGVRLGEVLTEAEVRDRLFIKLSDGTIIDRENRDHIEAWLDSKPQLSSICVMDFSNMLVRVQ